MIRFKLYFIFVLSCIFVSCKENEIYDPELNKPFLTGKAITNKLNTITLSVERNLIFATLSPEEKLNFWLTKFKKMQSSALNTAQKRAIGELIDMLSIQVFTPGDVKEVFQQVKIPNWIERQKSVFTDIQIHTLLFTYDDAVKESNLNSSGSEQYEDCHCAVGARYTCVRYTFPGVQYGDCQKQGECLRAPNGCGALMDNECDGNKCEY